MSVSFFPRATGGGRRPGFCDRSSGRFLAAGGLLLLLLPLALGCADRGVDGPGLETVLIESDSPLVAIRLAFRTGSIDDPPGKEGLATLTALMVGQGGTEERSYRELVEALYPLATSIGVSTDRELTTFSVLVHREKLSELSELLLEALHRPGFAESDLERHRQQLLAYLTSTLRAGSDELLGLEALQSEIFSGHPYGHPAEGTVSGLESITLDDVRDFYRTRFTRSRLEVGLAGGYDQAFADRFLARLAELPEAGAPPVELPLLPAVEGRRYTLIDKQTDSVGIHLGFPLEVNRVDDDYYALLVANAYFGDHRTFQGRLMQQLRGERGLNYGDYSYLEYFWNPPGTQTPTPGFPRRQQYFSIWVRPVVPAHGHFALRAAISELERLVERGLTEEEFSSTRDYVVNYSKLWSPSLMARLGHEIDSRFYGTPYLIDEIERRLEELTVEDVNRVIREHLSADSYRAVVVTADAPAFARALEADTPSPITYESEVKTEILVADQEIVALPVRPTSVEIVPATGLFAGTSPAESADERSAEELASGDYVAVGRDELGRYISDLAEINREESVQCRALCQSCDDAPAWVL